MRTARRHFTLALAASLAAVLGGSLILHAPASAAPAKVTIKAQLPAGFRLLATATSGKSYLAASSGGRVTLSNVSASDTNGMSLSVLSSSGSYVGPVILKYSTDAKGKKAAKSLGAAKFGFLKMKKATKSTVDLKKITVKATSNFAHLNTSKPPIAVTGRSVAVTAGAPPAAKNLGRSAPVRPTGVGKFADPTTNPLGDDADSDGIMAFADVDDDNDGKLDLVDDKFFDTPVADNKNVNGNAGLYTALVCGGFCVNLNAYGVTKPEDNASALTALKTMVNTFQGVFFSYNGEAVKTSFPTRSTREFGYFNIDCTGIAWCSGATSKAVTISPDFDNGSQPGGNALPLTSTEKSYSVLCGAGVVAKDPTNDATSPTGWPLNDAGTASAYDRMMDEWVFNTCDPDGDKLPNVIPSKGTISGGSDWVNEIKPRMAGPDGMRVGDAVRFALSDSSKNLVDSSTQVISGVIQTAPSVRTWQGATIHTADGKYTVPADMQSPAGTVTLTFWRPQRVSMGEETTWQDVGGLTYAFSGPSGACTITAAKTSGGTVLTPTTKSMNGKTSSVVVDPAADATPNPANFIEITADTSTCGAGAAVGQWSVSAMDKAQNSTHFKWQKGGNPAPQNPPTGNQPQNPPLNQPQNPQPPNPPLPNNQQP